MNKEEQLAKKLGDRRNQYLSLNNGPIKEVAFAEDSQFYGEIMDDGYIFNPYIHRRWLPAQFVRLFKEHKRQADRKKYYAGKQEYLAKYLISEIYKLNMLSKLNLDAYYERSKFFTVDICRDYFIEMFELISYKLKSSSLNRYNSTVYIPWYGLVGVNFTRGVVNGKLVKGYFTTGYENRIINVLEELRHSKSYERIERLCFCGDIFSRDRMRYILPSYDLFTPFDKAGLYYTIKHFLMFEDASYKGKSSTEGLELLRSELDNDCFNIEEAENELERILGEIK